MVRNASDRQPDIDVDSLSRKQHGAGARRAVQKLPHVKNFVLARESYLLVVLTFCPAHSFLVKSFRQEKIFLFFL